MSFIFLVTGFFLTHFVSGKTQVWVPDNKKTTTFNKRLSQKQNLALPHNGGKQQGPFDILSSLPENQSILANQEMTLQIGIRFKAVCGSFQLNFRGVDGVQVLSQNQFSFQECLKGQTYNNPVKVLIAPGTRGVLAIDVEYTSRGVNHAETRAISLFDNQGLQEFAQKVQPQDSTTTKAGSHPLGKSSVQGGSASRDGSHVVEKIRRSKVDEKILQKSQ